MTQAEWFRTLALAGIAAALQEALMRLPARQRQAVVLRHVEGLSNPEIVAVMETLLEVLRSSPFDAELVGRILSAQQRKLFEQHEIGLRILLAGLEQMSDAQRAAYADRLERVLRAPPRKGR